MFEMDGATAAVGGRVLLHPISLTLPARRVIGLIGHNGSGKTTLLRLLARQLSPSGGTITFEGRRLAEWGSRAFACRLAYLPQQAPAAAGMLVRELVALGRYPWQGALGRVTRADRDKVSEALALTGVEPFADRLVETLSGGERQRAWLAMLVAQDPHCLLLDEPTSALDIAHQLDVLQLIRGLSRERGLGVLMVLHDVNMAARFCDEILALHSGHLIDRAPPGELMQPDRLQTIFDVRMGVLRHPETDLQISYAM